MPLDVNTTQFTVEEAGPSGVQLYSGVNLSVVYGGATLPIEEAIVAIWRYVDAVFYIDGDVWLSYRKPMGGTLRTMVYGETYRLDMRRPCYWEW